MHNTKLPAYPRAHKWYAIIGFDGTHEINRRGLVRNIKTGTISKGTVCKQTGYVIVALCKNAIPKTFSIHRLLAIRFIPNPLNKPCVNHKNGIKTDNRLANLEWSTFSENILHAVRMGLIPPGTLQKNGSKLTFDQVRKIRNELKDKNFTEIAQKYNVCRTTIANIKNKVTFSNIK